MGRGLNSVRMFLILGFSGPTQVYLAAAKVGGIHANNTYLAEFIYQNLMMQANVIDALSKRRSKALVPGLQLHLPQARSTANG